MNRRSWLVLPALVALLVPAAFAGHEYKCTQGTQECLDMMAANYQKKGWVGLEFDKGEEGALVVKRVVPESPASAAGFKTGDVIAAVNGVEYNDENKDALKEQWGSMKPGKEFTFTVSRNGYDKKLTATLAKIPTEVLAAMIGNHMLDHATTAIAQN